MNENKLLNFIIRDIFKGITVEDILEFEFELTPAGKQVKGVKLGGQYLPASDIEGLKREVKFLKDSYLWKLIANRVRYVAQLNACNRAETEKDNTFGKASLYNLEVIEEVLENIEQIPVQVAPKAKAKT